MRWFGPVLCMLALLVLAACSSATPEATRFVVTAEPGVPQFVQPTSQPGYPGPTETTSSSYPAPESQHSVDGRRLSALESFKLAEQVAKAEYDQNAELYSIVPSQTMIQNLGGPPVLPGWFYKFKTPGSVREFIVQVVDDKVSGTTVAEPFEPHTPAELAIDVSAIKFDSQQVLEQFKSLATYPGDRQQPPYDLELLFLQGSPGPVWSVIDPATKNRMYSISAITGEEVELPK